MKTFTEVGLEFISPYWKNKGKADRWSNTALVFRVLPEYFRKLGWM